MAFAHPNFERRVLRQVPDRDEIALMLGARVSVWRRYSILMRACSYRVCWRAISGKKLIWLFGPARAIARGWRVMTDVV